MSTNSPLPLSSSLASLIRAYSIIYSVQASNIRMFAGLYSSNELTNLLNRSALDSTYSIRSPVRLPQSSFWYKLARYSKPWEVFLLCSWAGRR